MVATNECTVGVVQMNSQGDVGENLDRAATLCAQAAERGAQMVVLPENFAFFGADADKAGVAESLTEPSGPIAERLQEIASAHGIWIVGGGMPERSEHPARPHNTCVVVAPDGRLAASYRKIHLFDVEISDGATYRESDFTTAGSEPCVLDVAGIPTGLSVCYDLRFPELYRALTARGAKALVVPAAFTLVTGKDHWHVLLRARAIEAQCYVLAAAQWGSHPEGRRTFGKACIVDPWGEIVAQASEGEGVALAPLSLARVDRVRAQLPSLRHQVL